MKHISIALCLCGMILMNTSCDNYDDTYPQEYEKILSLQTIGEQAVDLYKTGERFGLCGYACQLLFVQHRRTRLFFC